MLNSIIPSGNQKQIVGIALTPGIGLEMVILDKATHQIVNYGRERVEYNFSTREINDAAQFKSALVGLKNAMRIPTGAPAYLVLPNVYFDFIEVPTNIVDVEIKTAILSRAEDFYLFKKEEPASGWCEVANTFASSQKRLAYASIQKRVVDELKDILVEAGFKVAGIEGAYAATLRGLYLTGALDDVILEDATWTGMIINTNSYTLFQFEGKNLIDYNEIPLATRSFSTEEAYAAIVSGSSQLLSNYSPTKLFLISQTDEICAKILKKQMQYDREIIAIDTNKFSESPVVQVLNAVDFDLANSVSLTAIGAACIKTDFGMVMNILADEMNANLGIYFTANVLGSPLEVTKEVVMQAGIVIVIICLIVFGGITALASSIAAANDKRAKDFQSQITEIETQISALSKDEEIVEEEEVEEVDINALIDEIATANVSAINFYDSISSDIPKNVWLTKYYNKAGTKLAVQGIAENIGDIYEYYKNLRIVSPQSDIKLTELKVITEDANDKYLASLAIDKDVDRLYSFEISNTQIEFNAPKNNQDGGGEDTKQDDESSVIPRAPMEDPSDQMQPTEDEE